MGKSRESQGRPYENAEKGSETATQWLGIEGYEVAEAEDKEILIGDGDIMRITQTQKVG